MWDIPLLLLAELAVLGVVTGFLAGLLGIGGGMIMVPVLTWLFSSRGVDPGLSVKMAIATAMSTILFTSISSLRAHHQRGAVRWPLVKSFAPGILVGGVIAGAGAFAAIKGQGLAAVFGVFTAFSASQMLADRKPKPTRTLPGPAGRVAVGGGLGFLSGLVGAGGAFLSVPYMIWCNVPVREAVGTSAAMGFPIALANTLGYVIGGWNQPAALPGAFGFLYLPALVIIATISVVMAPMGAKVAHTINTASLKKVFALVLFCLSAYMLYKATVA